MTNNICKLTYLTGEKESEQPTEEQEPEQLQDNEIVEQSAQDLPTESSEPQENEIKEVEDGNLEEKPCLECGEVTHCKYVLMKAGDAGQTESGEQDEDLPAIARPGIHYLCRIGCLNAFKEANSEYKLIVKKVAINYVVDTNQLCCSCAETKICRYRFKSAANESAFEYICEDVCLEKYTTDFPEKFVVTKKCFIVEEVVGDDLENVYKCLQCTEETKCKYTFKHDDESYYICQGACLNLLLAEQPDRYRIKRQSIRVKNLPRRSMMESTPDVNDVSTADSSDAAKKMIARTEDEARLASIDREASFCRRCVQCYTEIILNDQNLQWETMDFCNDTCLRQYQSVIGGACHTCQSAVSPTSMGKYCVRFGFELRQFCRSACLDTFKRGLKVCSHCQKDISKNEEFLAPINGQFKDFCSRDCLRTYEQIFNPKKMLAKVCAVCNISKLARVELIIDATRHYFCSNPCFSAFKFVNNINPGM